MYLDGLEGQLYIFQCFKGGKVRQGVLGTPGRLGDTITQGELGQPGRLGDAFKTLIYLQHETPY